MTVQRIYVAAAFGDRVYAARAAAALRREGFATTSRWHERELTPAQVVAIERDDAARAAECARDLADIREADALLLLWSAACRGSIAEATFALDQGKRVAIVADDRFEVTLMLARPGAQFFPTTHAALAALRHPLVSRFA